LPRISKWKLHILLKMRTEECLWAKLPGREVVQYPSYRDESTKSLSYTAVPKMP
jgi:hypothetical protein